MRAVVVGRACGLVLSAAMLCACSDGLQLPQARPTPPGDPGAAQAPALQDARLQAMELRLLALEEGIAQLNRQAPPASPASGTPRMVPGTATSAAAVGATPSPSPSEEQIAVARSRQLDAAFQNEPGDPRGLAGDAQSELRRALQSSGLASASQMVECRSRTCRVTLAGLGPDGEQAIQNLALQLAPTFGTVRMTSEGGANVLYVSP